MTHERRSYSGNAPDTRLASGISDTSTTIEMEDGDGYPTGGADGPFWIVIDWDQANPEKVKCLSRSGDTITVIPATGRGGDGTSPSAHNAGARVRHVWTKQDADEANAHYADDSLDHHGQYLNAARHDIPARHPTSALPMAEAEDIGILTVGSVAAAGTSGELADGAHVHQMPTLAQLRDLLFLPGEYKDGAWSAAPAGWLLCDGSLVSRSTYAALFAAIGTTYGVGDGVTTFALPDSRGRVAVDSTAQNPVGAGAGNVSSNVALPAGISARVVGSAGFGAETHTLTSAQMPTHTHTQNAHNHGVTDPQHDHAIPRANSGNFVAGVANYVPSNTNGGSSATFAASTGISVNNSTAVNQNTGGGEAHNIMQPSLVVTRVIKY